MPSKKIPANLLLFGAVFVLLLVNLVATGFVYNSFAEQLDVLRSASLSLKEQISSLEFANSSLQAGINSLNSSLVAQNLSLKSLKADADYLFGECFNMLIPI